MCISLEFEKHCNVIKRITDNTQDQSDNSASARKTEKSVKIPADAKANISPWLPDIAASGRNQILGVSL